MFTGIVTEIGHVASVARNESDAVLTIEAPATSQGLNVGESVAVAGVCLTATAITEAGFTADVMRETLRATRLGRLPQGAAVNLERAMSAGGRLDGHIVQGHVDTVAQLVERSPGRAWEDLVFELAAPFGRYVAGKGSITIDGVSLTVTGVEDVGAQATRFGVSLIPTTLRETTLGALAVGDDVNVEVDVIAKYVERLVAGPKGA